MPCKEERDASRATKQHMTIGAGTRVATAGMQYKVTHIYDHDTDSARMGLQRQYTQHYKRLRSGMYIHTTGPTTGLACGVWRPHFAALTLATEVSHYGIVDAVNDRKAQNRMISTK